MKSILIKLVIIFTVLISSLYFFGERQISAKQNKYIKPAVDLYYSWLNLYVGFRVENVSQYNQIKYEVSYTREGGQRMVSEGTIDNFSKESTVSKNGIILGSCSTGGTCIYDSVKSPIKLSLHFSNSEEGFLPVYSASAILK